MRLIGRLAGSGGRGRSPVQRRTERGRRGGEKNFETPGIAPFVRARGSALAGWPQVEERNHESLLPRSMEIHKGATGPFVIPRVSTCPSRPWLARNNVTLRGKKGGP